MLPEPCRASVGYQAYLRPLTSLIAFPPASLFFNPLPGQWVYPHAHISSSFPLPLFWQNLNPEKYNYHSCLIMSGKYFTTVWFGTVIPIPWPEWPLRFSYFMHQLFCNFPIFLSQISPSTTSYILLGNHTVFNFLKNIDSRRVEGKTVSNFHLKESNLSSFASSISVPSLFLFIVGKIPHAVWDKPFTFILLNSLVYKQILP